MGSGQRCRGEIEGAGHEDKLKRWVIATQAAEWEGLDELGWR